MYILCFYLNIFYFPTTQLFKCHLSLYQPSYFHSQHTLGIICATGGANLTFPQTNLTWLSPLLSVTLIYATVGIVFTEAFEKTWSPMYSDWRGCKAYVFQTLLGVVENISTSFIQLHVSYNGHSVRWKRNKSPSRLLFKFGPVSNKSFREIPWCWELESEIALTCPDFWGW